MKNLGRLSPLGAFAAGIAAGVVFLFMTFATKADVKDQVSALEAAITRIDQRTWEAWGKPRGEPEPPRAPAGSLLPAHGN